jgi:23S rRNA (pseudouridine1915-N3)-methyltransferase
VKLVIAAVGKPRDRHLAAAIDEYETRAARYWPLDVVEVREASGRGVAPEEVREREGARLLERIPAASLVVACDERGDQLTSAEFARLVNGARDRAQDVAFVIGGAFGLPDAVRQRAARAIQLAPFTLPHELARLVLAEQLYRAGTIVRGEPYHK